MKKSFLRESNLLKSKEGKIYQGKALKKQKVIEGKNENFNKLNLRRRRFLQKAGIAAIGGLSLATAEKGIEVAYKISNLEKSLRNRKNQKEKNKTLKKGKENNSTETIENKDLNQKTNNTSENITQNSEILNKKEYWEKPKDIDSPRAWCDFFLNKYEEISRKADIFPPSIFRDDFFMAIQLTESGYNSKSKSKKGASGLMQIMPSAIKDLPEFLNQLRKKGKIRYSGPAKLDRNYDDLIKRIIQLGLKKPNYNRAIGKLYLANLYYRYKIGRKEFKGREVKQVWKLLAAAYNQGASRTKKSETFWTKEARNYYKKVLNYIQRLDNIREHFQKEKIKTQTNYLRILLAKEMDRVSSSKKAQENKIGRYDALKKYLQAIKRKEKAVGRSLTNSEVQQIVNSQNTLKIVLNKSMENLV